jgi:hypothetical protein
MRRPIPLDGSDWSLARVGIDSCVAAYHPGATRAGMDNADARS